MKIDGRALSVHRLIQARLRKELPQAKQAEYRHEVHKILAAAAAAEPDNNAVWARYNELVAHVASPVTELAQCQDSDVRAFALNVVRYLYQSGDLASSKLLAEQFISQWTESSGADDRSVIDAQRHLSNTLRALGEYSEAYELAHATLRQSQQVLGERDRITPALRNPFGGDLRARGEFSRVLTHDLETTELHIDIFGPAHP